ncbi:MAG: DUF4956 domain-containing protein [Gemmatimonadaceae bacterium]
MRSLTQIIDVLTLGSDRPIRRLVAYYAFLGLLFVLLHYFLPQADHFLLGKGMDASTTPAGPVVLQDALSGAPAATVGAGGIDETSLAGIFLTTTLILVGTMLLMLPVSWVYMSARHVPGHSQAVVQTLIILPLVVAGIVLIVRDSLALAFSLAGVVAAVRFRANLRDTRDVVYIFLAIAVGFAAGVQTLAVGAVLTIVFNFVMMWTWRTDYGRNVLTPTAASRWSGPLNSLAMTSEYDAVPDRDLVLSLTPRDANKLAKRFERVSEALGGPDKKKAKYDSVLSLMSDHVGDAQELVERVLDRLAKRWRLDEVVTHTGKPSEIYYLVKLKKLVTRDEFLTAVREEAGERIELAELESRESVEEQVGLKT